MVSAWAINDVIIFVLYKSNDRKEFTMRESESQAKVWVEENERNRNVRYRNENKIEKPHISIQEVRANFLLHLTCHALQNGTLYFVRVSV